MEKSTKILTNRILEKHNKDKEPYAAMISELNSTLNELHKRDFPKIPFEEYTQTQDHFLSYINTKCQLINKHKESLKEELLALAIHNLIIFIDTPFDSSFEFEKQNKKLTNSLNLVLDILDENTSKLSSYIDSELEILLLNQELKEYSMINIERLCFVVKFLYEFIEEDHYEDKELYKDANRRISRIYKLASNKQLTEAHLKSTSFVRHVKTNANIGICLSTDNRIIDNTGNFLISFEPKRVKKISKISYIVGDRKASKAKNFQTEPNVLSTELGIIEESPEIEPNRAIRTESKFMRNSRITDNLDIRKLSSDRKLLRLTARKSSILSKQFLQLIKEDSSIFNGIHKIITNEDSILQLHPKCILD